MSEPERKNETFELFGVKLPVWVTCNRCSKELSCRWGGLVYMQPCRDCQNTDEWQKEQEEIAARPKEKSWKDIVEVNMPTAIYEIKDKKGRKIRNIQINHKGNIIQDDPWKPLKTGK